MTHPSLSTAFLPTPECSQPVTPTDTTSKLTQSGLNHESVAPSPSSPCGPQPLSASELSITLTRHPKPVPEPNSAEIWSLKCHTDHMLTCTWTAQAGWLKPSIHPFGPLTLSPMSSALHYATECFEGMKAYRGHDGRLRLFRPDRNCRRMLRSATRIALPGFDPGELRKLIEALVAIEGRRWLPDPGAGGGFDRGRWRGSYLYLRPTLVGTGNTLGVQRPTEALLFLVAMCFPPLDEPHRAPASVPPSLRSMAASSGPPAPGAPIPTTDNDDDDDNNNNNKKSAQEAPAMRLLASRHDMIRAWPGGFGHAKVGANYGPSLVAQQEARERGYDQILWLFGHECYVTEAGASNFFVIWRTRQQQQQQQQQQAEEGDHNREDGQGRLQLVTAPLGDGVILDGVTRASVLDLARERWGAGTGTGTGTGPGQGGVEMEVVERKYTMGEIVEAAEEGRLVEAFGCGTAFFVAPVAEIHFRGRDVPLPLKRGVEPTYAITIKTWLRDIMFGLVDHDWAVVVPES